MAELSDPFNPDEFGDLFAEALSVLCDDGTAVDVEFDTESADCLLTVGGVDYRVTIVVEGISSPN